MPSPVVADGLSDNTQRSPGIFGREMCERISAYEVSLGRPSIDPIERR